MHGRTGQGRAGQGRLPTAPTARAGTNMPVEAPTPLVHIMSMKEKRNRQVRAPKSNRKSVPSGRGSPRWIMRRRDCERGVKKTCRTDHHKLCDMRQRMNARLLKRLKKP